MGKSYAGLAITLQITQVLCRRVIAFAKESEPTEKLVSYRLTSLNFTAPIARSDHCYSLILSDRPENAFLLACARTFGVVLRSSRGDLRT